MMAFKVGQKIITGLKDETDRADVGDLRSIVDWQTQIALAVYRVTGIKNEILEGEIVEALYENSE